MSGIIDIYHWTEEYRKCKEVPGYLIRNYMRVIEADGSKRDITDEEASTAVLPSGTSLSCDLPEELKIGGLNYEGRLSNSNRDVIDKQAIINRLASHIAWEEAKTKKP